MSMEEGPAFDPAEVPKLEEPTTQPDAPAEAASVVPTDAEIARKIIAASGGLDAAYGDRVGTDLVMTPTEAKLVAAGVGHYLRTRPEAAATLLNPYVQSGVGLTLYGARVGMAAAKARADELDAAHRVDDESDPMEGWPE